MEDAKATYKKCYFGFPCKQQVIQSDLKVLCKSDSECRFQRPIFEQEIKKH